jgi:hypothetical protein
MECRTAFRRVMLMWRFPEQSQEKCEMSPVIARKIERIPGPAVASLVVWFFAPVTQYIRP